MIRNYLKVAFRIFTRSFGFSFINIFGLSIGLACCLLIGLYVRYELSYEDFHEHGDRIYRYIPRSEREGMPYMQTYTPAGLAPLLKEEFHEVQYASRFSVIDIKPLIMYGDVVLPPGNLTMVDSSFFKMFSFPLLRGEPATVLNRPLTVVISRKVAEAYFPGEDPVGKMIQYDGIIDLEVTGVVDNIPANTHLQFDYAASFISLPEVLKTYGWGREDALTQMDASNYDTYLMVNAADVEGLQKRMSNAFYQRVNNKPEPEEAVTDWLQPLSEIHFTQDIKGDSGGTGNIDYVYIFVAIAALVLIIACFNFMNLSTAQAIRRAKEVALRKSLGAGRKQLVFQFMGETLLMIAVASFIAFQLLEISIALFNRLMDMQLDFNIIDHADYLLLIFALGLVTAIVAGSYPALYLSSFQPVKVLKSDTAVASRSTMRKVLTVLQFGIATFMIISTIVVVQQMNFMRSAELGFNKEQVIAFIPSSDISPKFDDFKQRLLQYDGIEGVTLSNGVPGETFSHWAYRIPEVLGEKGVSINTLIIDYDYLDVLGIELVEGRKLSPEFTTDYDQGYLVNEAAVKEYMLEQPLGTTIQCLDGHEPGKIVGVIKDFHWRSLHNRVQPLVLRMDRNNAWRAAVKISGNIQDQIANIKKEWNRFSPHHTFDYFFVDDRFDQLYRSEEKTSVLMSSFSGLAVFVACLGLLGLSHFMTQQRKKEIGIRKVMGASNWNIVSLLSWDFVRIVLVGFLLFVPVVWYSADKWLENFAYQIDVNPFVFLAGGAIVVLMALLTVSIQSYKASLTNPAETLKCE